jgi:hypothetical protein
MKKIYKIILLVSLGYFLMPSVFALGGPPLPPGPGPGTGPTCWPPPCVPIDGGISFLIVAGIGLGLVKATGYRKRT